MEWSGHERDENATVVGNLERIIRNESRIVAASSAATPI